MIAVAISQSLIRLLSTSPMICPILKIQFLVFEQFSWVGAVHYFHQVLSDGRFTLESTPQSYLYFPLFIMAILLGFRATYLCRCDLIGT